MERKCLESIVLLCHEHDIMILADEVYQNNIYTTQRPFVSMRKVLHEMGYPFSDEVELVSMHSVSKGLLGECGLRGGYYELHNLSN
jgi:aspartate/methionine/tyrosine aminotransferase